MVLTQRSPGGAGRNRPEVDQSLLGGRRERGQDEQQRQAEQRATDMRTDGQRVSSRYSSRVVLWTVGERLLRVLI